jgi:cytochrome P450
LIKDKPSTGGRLIRKVAAPALSGDGLIPPGPAEAYSPTEDLLNWMHGHFKRYGNIYKASVYGTSAYVISAPEYAQHILRTNWQNYTKGQEFKRVALLLGNGLVVSEGEFWKKQRRMIQPAFHNNAIGALTGVISAANVALFERWQQAARNNDSVNVTRDVSLVALEVVLIAIFGRDYAEVAPHFNILSDESARDLQFAQAFRALGKIVVRVATRRQKENISSTDILGMLMAARDRDSGQAMPDHQLVNEIMTLIVAGHERRAP